MSQEYDDYIKEVKKVWGPREHRITNSFGIYDAFKFYRKNKLPDKKFVLTDSEYYEINRKCTQYLLEHLLRYSKVPLPLKFGDIELRSRALEGPKIDEWGRYINKAPIDWDATLKLWFEHEDARVNKILVRSNTKEITRILYLKRNAKYKHQRYVLFQPARSIKLLLKSLLEKGLIEGIKIQYNNGS